MEVNFLTKRNIQPNIPLSHSERNGHNIKSDINKEYNNRPTKDISFRGSAVFKASGAVKKAASKALDGTNIPNYAKKLVNSKWFNKAINALSVKCVEHLVERNHCSVYEATNQFTNTLTYQSLLDKTSDFYAYSPIDSTKEPSKLVILLLK